MEHCVLKSLRKVKTRINPERESQKFISGSVAKNVLSIGNDHCPIKRRRLL